MPLCTQPALTQINPSLSRMETRYEAEKVKFVKHMIVHCNSSSDSDKILRAETFCFITPTVIGSEAMAE